MEDKYKCSSCGLKDSNKYRFMRFKQDQQIYCEVCVDDIAHQEMNKFIAEEFVELK